MSFPHLSGTDRRRHDRHPLRTSVTLALPDGRVISGRTLDIGAGGAAIVCDLNLRAGIRLSVRLRLPARPEGTSPFAAVGTVANCTLAGQDGGFRLGVEFEPLDAAAAEALKGALP